MNDVEKVRQLTSGIDGWLSDSEGELLYELAKKVPSGQAIVEISSWKGKSTVWLAKGTEAGQRNKVHSVDPHSGSKAHISEGETNTYPAFVDNLTKAGVQDIVVPLVKTSAEAVERWREGIGLLWIDAMHEYEDVKRDFLSWEPHLLPGARVAFHDCDQAGPAQVVKEYINHSNGFTIVRHVATIVVAEKSKCIHHWVIDSNNFGVCKYCGLKRDFGKLRQKQREKATEKQATIGRNTHKTSMPKGRKRKHGRARS
ncbi:unnamed protein product [marine sediment metagenome]|uniref:Class I SAM-dependent methyltransferase n=2 Tax=marine sediment metagenome TaxID=412755 RepID=X1AN64_9ZZZZ